MHPHRKGFSLVELSIVPVILGLLVGGVLSGQSLIRAAELRYIFFRIAGPTNHLTAGNTFTAEEAWNIDTKMDDGKPDNGIITSILRGVYNTSCATSGTPGSADYSLNVTGKQCGLVIISGF